MSLKDLNTRTCVSFGSPTCSWTPLVPSLFPFAINYLQMLIDVGYWGDLDSVTDMGFLFVMGET